jgi:sulfur-oxidizing protein SoxB
MNLTKREFLQVLGAGTMAGMALGRYADADAATAARACTTCPSSATCLSCT